jgi:cytochrome c-type biogenesis protein CcmH
MIAMRKLAIGALIGLALSSHVVLAVEPDEVLPDPAQEARARTITKELRCVVCQNQSVDDSDAPLAKDVRILVRERIAAGESDEAVRAFIVERYGQYVLLRPPLGVDTALIWIGPFALFFIALGIAVYFMRKGRGDNIVAPALTPEEQKRVDATLQDDRR